MLWTSLDDERGPFFRVLETTRRTQTAVMTVPAGAEAGPPEVHPDSDQVFVVVSGRAEVKVWPGGEDGEDGGVLHREAGPGTVFTVPAGVRHWVRALDGEDLYFFTVYGAPAY